MCEEVANNKLLEYNYINIITPFKHKFAKLNNKKEVEKKDGNHIYERAVEFKEYYDSFVEERKRYPTIVTNILDFEIHFKTIISYNIFTSVNISNSNDLYNFLNNLKLKLIPLSSKYNEKK